MFQEGDYHSAMKSFTGSMNIQGYKPDLAYNIALCHYRMKQYSQALKYIADIIERGIKDHPGESKVFKLEASSHLLPSSASSP